MRRASPVLIAAVLGLAAAHPGCWSAAPADPRPNVLLITVDTLRADYLGSYGFDWPTSPRVDALAAEGVLFERAIAASSSTVPAHATILTSRYTREHTIGHRNGDSTLSDETSVAEIFRGAGYATAAFVGNYLLRRGTGLARGFEVYDDELTRTELNRRDYYERIAGDTNQRALRWIAEVDDVPFFLWVHYQDPHGPYAPPEPYVGRFRLPPDPDEAPLEVVPSTSGWRSIPEYQALEGLFRPSQYAGRYADEIHYADRAIGQLLDAVDRHASGREVVVLFTSDHGESFGEGGRYFVHGFATTPQLAHVPMILRAPGLSPERRRDPVHHVDVMPTLLELAGIELPPDVSGRALGPYLREGRSLEPRIVFCDIGFELSAYRSDSFLRVLGPDEGQPGADGEEPTWLAFDWHWDGSWSVAEEGALENEAETRETLRHYLSDRKAIKWALLSGEELERLHALGYVLARQPDERGAPDAR
jgi:arylsulfatase